MKISLLLLTALVISGSAGRVAAQTQELTGKDTVRLTARPVATSFTDTLLFQQGRQGGRFFVYFLRGQAKWFKIDPSLKDKFNGHKLKAYQWLRIPVVFCPPAGFSGEAHTWLVIQGISGYPWITAEVVGLAN